MLEPFPLHTSLRSVVRLVLVTHEVHPSFHARHDIFISQTPQILSARLVTFYDMSALHRGQFPLEQRMWVLIVVTCGKVDGIHKDVDDHFEGAVE